LISEDSVTIAMSLPSRHPVYRARNMCQLKKKKLPETGRGKAPRSQRRRSQRLFQSSKGGAPHNSETASDSAYTKAVPRLFLDVCGDELRNKGLSPSLHNSALLIAQEFYKKAHANCLFRRQREDFSGELGINAVWDSFSQEFFSSKALKAAQKAGLAE